MERLRNSLLVKVYTHYGFNEQCGQLTEEVGELLQAVNKYRRKLRVTPPDLMKDTDEFFNLIEELGDVRNVVDGLSILLECEHAVSTSALYKMKREWSRICGTTLDKL